MSDCSILNCKLPQNEMYRDSKFERFCWCTLHGEYYAAINKLRKEWLLRINAANKQIQASSMDPLKDSVHIIEPTHPADILWEFLAWVRQKDVEVIDLSLYVEEFKEQYRD